MSANYDATIGGTTDQSKSQAPKSSGSGRSFSEQSAKTMEDVHELGRIAVDKAGDAATSLREKGSDALEAGKEKAKSLKSGFDNVVAEHPMKSVLIALGVGAVIGYSLRRRS